MVIADSQRLQPKIITNLCYDICWGGYFMFGLFGCFLFCTQSDSGDDFKIAIFLTIFITTNHKSIIYFVLWQGQPFQSYLFEWWVYLLRLLYISFGFVVVVKAEW